MVKDRILFVVIIIVTFLIIGASASLIFSRFIDFNSSNAIELSAQKIKQTSGSISFNPPQINNAPEDIKGAVVLGYNLIIDTRKYAADYVGNNLDCDNCHFNGGITEGGKNGGLSLVGVGATYPKYRKRQDYSVNLESRINDCFVRSMNGNPLPLDSKEITAIVTYLQWISKGLPIYAEIPWLSIKLIKSTQKRDTENGKQIFAQQCAICHGNDGQGTLRAPPIWGSHSFNDGAGMHKSENLAVFAFDNMPKSNPYLSDEQALDVAEFVSLQPRPHFETKNK